MGKFTLDRKIWQASPWKLKIWIYLYEQANYTDSVYQGIEIKRGQIYRSLSRIAKDCSYKIGYRTKKPLRSTIERVVKELAKEERITQRPVLRGTLYTIRNYEALQAFPETRTKQQNEQSEGILPGSISAEEATRIDTLMKLYEEKFPGHLKRFGRMAAISKMRDVIEGAYLEGISLQAIKGRIDKAKDGTPWKILSEEWIAKMKKEKVSYEKLIKLYGGKES